MQNRRYDPEPTLPAARCIRFTVTCLEKKSTCSWEFGQSAAAPRRYANLIRYESAGLASLSPAEPGLVERRESLRERRVYVCGVRGARRRKAVLGAGVGPGRMTFAAGCAMRGRRRVRSGPIGGSAGLAGLAGPHANEGSGAAGGEWGRSEHEDARAGAARSPQPSVRSASSQPQPATCSTDHWRQVEASAASHCTPSLERGPRWLRFSRLATRRPVQCCRTPSLASLRANPSAPLRGSQDASDTCCPHKRDHCDGGAFAARSCAAACGHRGAFGSKATGDRYSAASTVILRSWDIGGRAGDMHTE